MLITALAFIAPLAFIALTYRAMRNHRQAITRQHNAPLRRLLQRGA